MNKKDICILDYGSGNVGSVKNFIESITPNVVISNNPDVIRSASHLILPGVGSFGAAMKKINKNIPMDVLTEVVINQKKPFLGICVGMQVLASVGYEFGEYKGLDWIAGRVEKLNSMSLPLPHVGWNNLLIQQPDSLFAKLGNQPDFYFVHSYIFRATHREHVLAATEYGEEFCCAVKKNNIYGVQFHPEKSQRVGQIMIKNFLSLS